MLSDNSHLSSSTCKHKPGNRLGAPSSIAQGTTVESVFLGDKSYVWMWRTALLAPREEGCSPELREAEQEQLGESERFTNEAYGDIPASSQSLVLLRRIQVSRQEGSGIRSSTQLVPRCLPVLRVLLHWGVFRAGRSRWWERDTCFIGMWIAEFAALERIT